MDNADADSEYGCEYNVSRGRWLQLLRSTCSDTRSYCYSNPSTDNHTSGNYDSPGNHNSAGNYHSAAGDDYACGNYNTAGNHDAPGHHPDSDADTGSPVHRA
jgi:hypothetical protein